MYLQLNNAIEMNISGKSLQPSEPTEHPLKM